MKAYAFWSQGQYPYLLAGPVVGEANENGYVKITGYGNHWFKPLTILPHAQGLLLHQELADLEQHYNRAKRELKEQYEQQLQDVLPPILKKK